MSYDDFINIIKQNNNSYTPIVIMYILKLKSNFKYFSLLNYTFRQIHYYEIHLKSIYI